MLKSQKSVPLHLGKFRSLMIQYTQMDNLTFTSNGKFFIEKLNFLREIMFISSDKKQLNYFRTLHVNHPLQLKKEEQEKEENTY